MLQRILVSLMLLVMSVYAQAQGIDFRLSSESAEFNYLMKTTTKIGVGGADVGMGLFWNENDDLLANFKGTVSGALTGTNRSVSIGGGIKFVLGKVDRLDDDSDNEIGSLAIGGKIAYIFPATTPMSVYVEGFYAPDVTSFADNKSFTELNIGFDVEVAAQSRLYVGYHKMEVDFEDGLSDYELDDNLHVGVQLSF
ncbi:MAG: hypothetical protein H0W44_04380 [Gammaproteobacteria bacterium]|nr:hypothetical protein [Gammaproteobacteria bacterium]